MFRSKPTTSQDLQKKINNALFTFVSTKETLTGLLTQQQEVLNGIRNEQTRLAEEAAIIEAQQKKTTNVIDKLTELLG